jgi:hypothetical protein
MLRAGARTKRGGGRSSAVAATGVLVAALLLATMPVSAQSRRENEAAASAQEELRAMREMAACTAVPRDMTPAERTAHIPKQVALLTAMLEEARRKEHEESRRSRADLGPTILMEGGAAPAAGWFKETVALRRAVDDPRFCTGALIAEDAVATAAHCVCDLGLDESGPAGLRPFVRFATVARSIGGGVPASVFRPYDFSIIRKRTRMLDPAYCRKRATGVQPSPGHDLAVVFFDTRGRPAADADREPLQIVHGKPDLSQRPLRVAPARIATTSLFFTPSLYGLIGVGFGQNQRYPGLAVKTLACVQFLSRMCGWSEDQQALGCAGGRETALHDPQGRKDSCYGDSGGPVFAMVETSKAEITYYLVGITSRAIDRTGACGPGGIYTLITPQIVDWMRRSGAAISFYDYPNQ